MNDTKNLVCVNGWWYLRARIKGAVIKQTLGTKELSIARAKRNQLLQELKAPADKKALLESLQIQLLGIEQKQKEELKAANLGIRLCDMWDKFLKDPSRREVCDRVLEYYQSNWQEYIDWMRVHYPHVQYSHQVTKTMGREWAAFIKEKFHAAETSKKKFFHIRLIWRVVSEYDDEQINPFEGMRGLARKNNSVVKEPFTPEEMRLIFSPENPVQFRLVSGFMFYLTLRWNEAMVVTWDQIHDGYFFGTHTKTGADATTRIPPQLQELIDLVPMEERQGKIFKAYDKVTGNHVYNAQLRALGIETHRKVEGSDRLACIKGAHSFRHTAITEALRNGNTVAAVRRLAGHATEAMQRRYTHMDANDAGDVAESLEKYW